MFAIIKPKHFSARKPSRASRVFIFPEKRIFMNTHSANVARFLRESAERVPDVCAIRLPDGREFDGAIRYRELSFAELDRHTAAAAEIFRRNGIATGTRTLLMARPGWDLILCAFALFRIGAVPVAIDPGMGLRHFLRCVENTRPEALVGIRLAHWVSRFFRKAFASVKTKLVVGNKKFNTTLNRLAADPSLRSEIAVCADDAPAAILFTSGSTGAPKGVCYTHGMFDAQQRIVRDYYKIEAGEIDLPLLPIFALFNPALGMTTITPEMNPSKPANLDPEKIVRAIRQNKVTNSFGSPILWRKIAEYCDARGETLPSIRRILCAGTAVHPSVMALLRKVLPNAEIHSPYGATENLPVADVDAETVLGETGALTARGFGTCTGNIVPGNRIRLVPASDEAFPDFAAAGAPQACFRGFPVGEICVCGPTTTRAYDNNARATALAKISDPSDGTLWHRMGDLGYLDEKGRLWFLGRKVERVETQQGTLYTEACEPIFNTHPDVFRSALIGLGERGKAIPAIVVELRAGTPKRRHAEILDELGKLAQQHEGTQTITRFFIYPKKFPVDVRHNAKIHRLTLREFYSKKLS